MRCLFLILLFAIQFSLVFSQTQLNPCVTDNGGGIVQNSSVRLLSSIGQTIQGPASNIIRIEAGYITTTVDLTNIDEKPEKRPEQISTEGFYPNPFNSSTRIEINIGKSGRVFFDLFDILGNKIFVWDKEFKGGDIIFTFTPSEELPNGTYLYSITTPTAKRIGKITFIK